MRDTHRDDIQALREFWHPDYEGLAADAEYHSLSVEGGYDYKEGKDARGNAILPQYELETDEAYQWRVAGTPLLEIAARYVRQRAGAVFSSPPHRPSLEGETTDEDFAAFVDDVDKQRHDLDWWMQRRLSDALTTRRVFLGVDSPRRTTDGGPISRAQAEAEGIRPYLVHADPRNVVDWSFDDSGALSRIVVRYEAIEKDGLLTGAVIHRWYVEWTPDEWARYDVTEVKDSEGKARLDLIEAERERHDFGRVPWVILEPLEGESYAGRFAELQKWILQTSSHVVAEQVATTFTLRVISGAKPEDVGKSAITPGGVLVLTEPDAKVQELGGDPNVMRNLRENLVMWLEEAHRRSEMSTSTSSAQPQSGVAKAYDFRELDGLLKTLAEACEEAENALIELWAIAAGKSEDLAADFATTAYNRDFDVLARESLFEQFQFFLTQSALPVDLKRMVLKRLITRLFPTDTEERRDLLEAVESWEPGAAARLMAPPRTGMSLARGERVATVSQFGRRSDSADAEGGEPGA